MGGWKGFGALGSGAVGSSGGLLPAAGQGGCGAGGPPLRSVGPSAAPPSPSEPSLCSPAPFKPFIIFSNRHEIRRIDLHRGDYSVLVPGLRNTIALDFHLNQSSLYWTDVVEDKIYRGKLLENGGA